MTVHDKKAVSLVCPHCRGEGVTQESPRPHVCPICKGKGSYLWSHGLWITWDTSISQMILLEERMERVVRSVLDGLFLAFGIVGAGFGVLGISSIVTLTALSDGIVGVPEIMSDFWALRYKGMLVFWLSVLGDLYLFYRFEKSHKVSAPIPSASTIDIPPPAGSFLSLAASSITDVSRSYSRPARALVEQAFYLALRLHHERVEPLHLLAVAPGDRDINLALLRLGIGGTPLRKRLLNALSKLPRGKTEPWLSSAMRAVLVRAFERAQGAHLLQVTPPHILEALAAQPSEAQEILFDLNADEHKVHHVVLWALIQRKLYHRWSKLRVRALNKPKSGMDRAMTAQATPVLDHFSTDLTMLARGGMLPLVLDRERELEDAFRVVESGRHNVILVGEKGVGTTSLLLAVAERMAAEDVPEVLKDKRLVQLSVSALVSGAGGGGQLEERLQEIIVEIIKSGNIVLAIEDIHELVGVSSVSTETLDLAAILGKVLDNRAFVAFATTTIEGYRRYVEPSALFTSFEKVDVDEVTPEVAILILESKVQTVESRHQVFFSYGAIEKIVNLCVRYIHDRRLPEKALVLLEEVGAYTRAAKGKNAVVTEDDAAAVVSRRTNTNVASLTEDETHKLLHLEERMHERMIGQDYAVAAVANALRRSRAELRDPKRPIAVFLFLGPTGVGKTELAKTVADVYFGSETTMVRLDMSEYQDTMSLSRLLGAPPGYAGATAGYLTEAVRRNPFSLVLLDELEKAHPDVLNVFLQVFDDGRLTDSSGRTIDFTNAIIIATSNAGTDIIQQRMKQGMALEKIRGELIEQTLGHYFRPEFLNRFDDVIVFSPLTREEIGRIASLLLNRIARQLELRGIFLRATPEAVRELAEAGFDPIYGARPLRRVLQEKVDNALATFLLTGKLGRRDVAVLEPGGAIRVEHGRQL